MIKVITKEIAIHNLYALKLRTRALSDRDALDLAINALEQQPCEDAISREDAINVAIDAVDEWDGGCNTSRATIICKAIKKLPSVTPSYNSVKTELKPS
jgi:hypothetical protein